MEMGPVKHIETDTQFAEEIQAAATSPNGPRLVVVDFFATWCGPCTQIAPFYSALSLRYPHVTFLKVDVDKLETIAATYNIRAMPTFVFLRNSAKVDQLSGANPEALEMKVKELAGDPGEAEGDIGVKGQMDLVTFIQKSNCECLNGLDEHPLDHALIKGKNGGYLASDTDEQLIIYVTFNQMVKLHSLRINAPPEVGPKIVKLYVNQISTPDFDTCESTPGVQDLDLTPDDLKEDALIPLKYVKFQHVNCLSIFVKNNQTGADQTQIHRLAFIGSPVNTTNMNEFKRVAGKKGESHG